MSVRLENVRRLWGRVAFTIVVAAWTAQAADAPAPSRPIEFSDPRSDTLTTNVNPSSGKFPGAPGLEANLPGLESFASLRGSLIGALPSPPSRGAVVNKRETDLFDSGNNFLVQSPEETMRELLVKGLLKTPDRDPNAPDKGSMQPSAGSMDRLYEGMVSGRPQTAHRSQYYDSFGSRKTTEQRTGFFELEESKSSWGDSDATPSKSSPGSDPFSRLSLSSARPNTLSDVFGLRNNGREDDRLSPDKKREEEAMKEQLEAFRSILSYPVSPLEGPGPLAGPSGSNPWLSTSSPLPVTPDLHSGLAPFQGTGFNPSWQSPAAPAAPIPSSLSPLPYTPPPSRTAAPKPIFTVPQRAF